MPLTERAAAFALCAVHVGRSCSSFIRSEHPLTTLRTPSSTLKAPTLRLKMSSSAVGTGQGVRSHADIVRGKVGDRFCQYVVHAGVCTTSGQVSRGGSVSQQTLAILDKIDKLLEEAGTDKSRLLSATIWLADISTVAEMNAVWDQWVDHDNLPARACVEAKLVDDEISVEIQVTAAMPAGRYLGTTVIETKDAAAAVGPYSQAVRVENGTVYVSGCIGLVAGKSGEFAGTTVEEQTKQALSNLAAILKAAGPNPRIVKTTVLLHDMADFATVNGFYDAFFAKGGPAEGPVPARSCFAAKSLPKGALVEIEAIAVTQT